MYKGGKIMQKWIILIIVILIAITGVFIILNVDIESEYVPEEEVKETEMRNTIITLYFLDKTNGSISKETRMIDSKELLKNPYKTLIQILINGPENSNCEKIIPENTQILDINFENGVVIVNFSKEFSENVEPSLLQASKDAIKQTLIELTEVTDVRILVEGIEIEI